MIDGNYNLYTQLAARYEGRHGVELLRTAKGETWTFSAIDQLAARMQSLLASLGVMPGDRVSVQLEKSPQALCLYLACLRGGVVFHPLNPAYTASELGYFLEDAAPAIVICSPTQREVISELCAVPILTMDADGGGTLLEFCTDMPVAKSIVAREKDDLAALLYSSGTTGKPKGIMLSCDNLVSNTAALAEAWEFSPDDCLLHALPIFHVHGLFVAIGCVMWSGARMRWLAGFNVAEVIENLPACTVMMGVPTYYTRLLADPGFSSPMCESVRLFVSGSAPLREETFRQFEKRTGHRILERYGMTETNMNASNPLHGERRPGTVGTALPGVQLRVVNEQGAVLANDAVGNLQVKGPNVFTGYWNKPEATEKDFTADGFFNTGDQAAISADGYVTIVGRAKDLIISGGLNVYPKEVELVLDAQPGVAESAVIGVAHADFGEAVVAVVVAEPGSLLDERAVLESLRSQLAAYKLPKKIVTVQALPRNSMAKVQKNALRIEYASLFSTALADGESAHD